MKSIKEKEREYANEQDLRMAYNGSCDNYRQGFVAGANYVLECFESTLPFVAKKGIIYGKIKETIEQLKK